MSIRPENIQIRRALAQWRVRSSALSFAISPFHFFELFSKLLQSKPTQAAIFEQFFDFEFQSTQTWTRIRATTRVRAEIELEFELEQLFLFEKRACEAASPGAIGRGDSQWFSSRVSLFLKRFSERFFLKSGAKQHGLKNVTKSNKKRA